MLKRLFLMTIASTTLVGCAMSPAASPDARTAVAAASEKLRVAMIDPTPGALNALLADQLSYGHSAGKLDTKATFVKDLLDGTSDFVTIAITEQTINVVDNVAVVRHTLAGDIVDGGKPGKVNLKVLGVWQRQDNDWKLLARQALRPPQ